MSRIFLATEASLNRRVVVKVLPPEMTSEVSAARFRKEIEVLARLQHPHILPILASGSRGDLLYYIMPFVAGESLRHHLAADGALPVDHAVRIIAETADALSYAHANGILHRDIKPENILLEGKHAVLADFGIARALAESLDGAKITATGTSVGTPGYMSPEQLSGDALDARADVYALAVVGYEMLAGHPPFTGPTAQAILTAHLTTPPLPLRELRPEVPLHVSNAIGRALSKQPSDRFTTAEAFADAINPGFKDDVRDDVRQPLSKRRMIALVSGGAIVLAIAAWAVSQMQSPGVSAGQIAAMRTAADSGELDLLASLLDSAGLVATDRRVRDVTVPVSGQLHVTTDARGATVEIARATPFEGFPKRTFRTLGETPIDPVPLVAGTYVIRVTQTGHPARVALADVAPRTESRIALVVPATDTLIGPTLAIPAGRTPGSEGAIPGFVIAQFEVTNELYQRFVASGGYRNPADWPPTLRFGDSVVPASAGLARFVDKTGLPGPRAWESGRYPAGTGDHPVTGVSWYEASAYARWANASLPTLRQWWRAAQGDTSIIYPWGVDASVVHLRANLEGVSTKPVGSFLLGVSRFGVLDMAGNVREWLLDSIPGGTRRLAVGGSWQDPSYMADPAKSERFMPDFANEAFGFRLVRPLPTTGQEKK